MNDRNNGLDVLKIIATSCIVFHHYQQGLQLTYPTGINYYDFNLESGNFSFGYLVELFFIISGYFLFHYVKRINEGLTFRLFIMRRVFRLLPVVTVGAIGFEIVVALGTLYKAPYITNSGYHVSVWGFLTCAAGIQDGWSLPNYRVNNPMWYVSVLIWCYIIFFFVTWIANKMHTPPEKFYIALIMIGFGINTFELSFPFFTTSNSRGYIAVFAGILLADILSNIRDSRAELLLQLCSVGVIVFWMYCYYKHKSWIMDGFDYLLVFMLYPAIIIFMQNDVFKKIFKPKWIGTLGKITFDVYVWHGPLLVAIRCLLSTGILNYPLEQRRYMYLTLVMAFLIGVISYYCIEQPINYWIKKKGILGVSVL